MIALLAPGQGSQKPGMLTAWLDQPSAVERLRAWSEIADLDLVRLGTIAEADEITDTAVTQPLVVAAALLAFEQMGVQPSDTVVAGHSVGELAAAAVAGVITADDAVRLAAIRGRAMAAACALVPTSMTAVLGGDEADVLATLESFDLIPANMNASGQIVAAGTVENLQKLADNAPEKARLRPLAVAGAFHTEFMAPAQEAVAAAAQTITPRDPQLTLLSNRDGKPVTSGAEALAAIVAQVTRPVRWDLCTATMREAEVSMVVELPPAGALVGIAKRELKGVPQVAVKTPADLTELLAPAQ
ncbi:ACP S-malonyltransferase [Tsukamurella tyrosinosolvens]|uniref:[acyl-carrier-protein] S-malonyltransferase n=1 Tax=Tsukamurella tyrosinosolvens TaxID=57704 RepID=A0A1H4XV32_TSUTY|nr:ACP S-malonyltransferase [Tsukamurella tyrosinosolvens]AUN41180.1 ACP S-malonyltransferase [Tsukamurella tyrosinosolvens]MEC4613664.1 ACP S-malonyltransferase [Tsukamurella tyrosinosolvens]QRY83949.1 ACP S-malonyltransferase [Tsukamurella tyrosinosolvens]RDB46954.1 ACP S-malonyltransferase [Tsukamurella tyrosinosolvens]SED08594.1 [acyl-carrier-protein] S-malonyltransferase [Tsukamurella tyrosinosolvens]